MVPRPRPIALLLGTVTDAGNKQPGIRALVLGSVDRKPRSPCWCSRSVARSARSRAHVIVVVVVVVGTIE